MTKKMKNKTLAGLLSVIFPGLGHLYVGRYTDGIGLWNRIFVGSRGVVGGDIFKGIISV